MGDMVGRKRVMIIGLLGMIVGMVWTLLSNNLFLAAAGMFVALIGGNWAFRGSFAFISETVA